MTKAQAMDLQSTSEQNGSPICEHRKVELERNEIGGLTGNYQCTTCGHSVPRNATRRSKIFSLIPPSEPVIPYPWFYLKWRGR